MAETAADPRSCAPSSPEGPCGPARGGSVFKDVEDFANGVIGFEWMAQVAVENNLVVVSTSNARVAQIATLFEFVHNALHRSFGDADEFGDLSLADVRVAADGNQNMGVIRQELPRARFLAQSASGRIEFHDQRTYTVAGVVTRQSLCVIQNVPILIDINIVGCYLERNVVETSGPGGLGS